MAKRPTVTRRRWSHEDGGGRLVIRVVLCGCILQPVSAQQADGTAASCQATLTCVPVATEQRDIPCMASV